MANANSENPYVGRKFQELVQSILEKEFSTSFEQEAVVAIGKPPKEHKFDLANEDRSIVAECKCYTWTDSGNVPSAKLMGLDEAVFYFSFLPAETKKILCIRCREFERFITELEKLPDVVTEFDEALWGSLVETVTVYGKEDIRFLLPCEIEIKGKYLFVCT